MWHSDLFGKNFFLGEARIPIGQLVDSGYSLETPAPKWFALSEKVWLGPGD